MNKSSKLDISSLIKALASLDEAVTEFRKDQTNKFVRDASIQRFEYTYELCGKMLKRYLEMTESSAEVIDQMAFPNLIRTGFEKGLLQSSWDVWKEYRDARNITSHTYDEEKAKLVCEVLPLFLKDARFLELSLQQRISS